MREKLSVHVPVKAGVHEILDFFKKQGVHMAVASSSLKEQIEANLIKSGIRDYFTEIVSGTEVEHGKPAPDIFLYATKKIGYAPEECYVFEDSKNGVKAAHAAGCKTIMIPDLIEPIPAIVPLSIMQGIMFCVNSTSIKENVDNLMVNELVQMAERTNLTLDIYLSQLYQIYTDNQIIENINCLLDEDNTDQEIAKREIYDRIKQYDISAEGIECISIILSDGQQLTYDFDHASTVRSVWDGYGDLREIQPYIDAQDAAGIVITPTMYHDVPEEEQYLFHISKTIYDYNDLEKGTIATIVMSIDVQVLDKICTEDYEHDPNQDYNVNFIVDENGYILSYPDIRYLGKGINEQESIEEFVQQTGKLNGKNIAVNQYEDKNHGWTFYNVYDRDYMLFDVWKTMRFAIGVALFFIIFAIVMMVYTIAPIKRTMRSTIQGIREVQEGNLDVKVPVESDDELGEIAENFNAMTTKLQELFMAVTDATQKQKEAEIRALEAQINPHFLYNTLDSINWMAIDKGEYEISKMLRDLGVILRYSVNKSNKIVKIEEETDWIQKYVGLQQLRFNHSFSFELHVEENAKNVQIYKLLLQPFVENAIIHGFKEIISGGILRVDIMLSENKRMLYAIVEDNGKGMSAEMVKKYNDRENVLHKTDGGIGLTNSFHRLNMYYGNDAGWNISSILNEGTVITLKIPIMKDLENSQEGYV